MVISQGEERAALGRAAMQVGATFSRYERYLVKVLTTMTAQVSCAEPGRTWAGMTHASVDS